MTNTTMRMVYMQLSRATAMPTVSALSNDLGGSRGHRDRRQLHRFCAVRADGTVRLKRASFAHRYSMTQLPTFCDHWPT